MGGSGAKTVSKATIKFKKQLPAVLAARKRNKHMAVKAKVAKEKAKQQDTAGARPALAAAGALSVDSHEAPRGHCTGQPWPHVHAA